VHAHVRFGGQLGVHGSESQWLGYEKKNLFYVALLISIYEIDQAMVPMETAIIRGSCKELL
jgi:hypothetical protein